ncbi:MAG: hypothetical protein K9J17_13450 [Flavobacteriales bacterium]|nr:hypothetical protein [Flavobacteriales bacterium]
MTDQIQTPDEEKNHVYWFFFNLRTRIGSGVKAWMKRHPVWVAIIMIVLLFTLVVDRATFQPILLAIRQYLALVVLVLLVFGLFILFVRKRTWKRAIVPSILLVAFLVLSFFSGPYIHNYFSLYIHYSSLNKVELSEIPVSGHERIQPVNSIRTLINQEALSETEDATQPRFTKGADGNYYFTAAVGPATNYWIQRFSKHMYEVLNVPAYLPSPVFDSKHRAKVNFEIGEQLLFSHKTENAVVKRFGVNEFLNCEPAAPLYLQDDSGNWVQVVPIVRWKGFLFPRPVFGGVYVIQQEGGSDNYLKRVFLGKGDFLSPEELLKHKYLVGQNLQPFKALNYTANSFKFANGFLAPFPGYHEGDVRIPEVASDQNPMPFITYFTIKGEGKLYNYFGMEPYEENKKGLSLSLFIPGDNDHTVYFINHRSEKYIGSGAISAKIVESKKNYDWSVNYPAESRPYVRNVDGKTRFFWLSTIVSRAGKNEGEYIGGSIPEICLTDAVYGKVTWIAQDSLMDSESWLREAERQMKGYWDSE